MDAGSLHVRLGLQSAGYNAGLDKASAKTRAFANTVKGLATAAIGGTAIYAVTNFAKKLVTLQAEFSYTMSRVKALTGATTQQQKAMTDLARQLGSETQYTATQAGDAMNYLAMAGLKTDQILKALPGTLQLAAAGNIQLAEAADIATNIMSAYNLKAKDLTRVNDVIANTVTNANTDVLEFAEAFKMVGPIAKSAGMKIEDVSASIGVLANSGIKGTMAGTQLRGMLAKLLNPTGDAKDKLQELGVTVLDNQGKMRRLNDIMKDLKDSGATTSDMFTIFDNRAAAAATVLSSNSYVFEDFAKIIERNGTAAKIADDQMNNLKGDLLKLTSAWSDLMLEIGEGADNELRKATQEFTDIFNILSKILDKWNEFKKTTPVKVGKRAILRSILPAPLQVLLGIRDVYQKATGGKVDITGGTDEMPPPEIIPEMPSVPGGGGGVGAGAGGGKGREITTDMPFFDTKADLEDPANALDRQTEALQRWIDKTNEAIDPIRGLKNEINEFTQSAAAMAEGMHPAEDTISKFNKLMIKSFGEMATSIQDFVVKSGAGLKEYANILRDTVKQAISAQIAKAVSAMVANAIESTSLAPFGWLLAPVAAAGAAAAANSLFDKLIPSFESGITRVPFDMPAILHKDERVLTAAENRRYTEGVNVVPEIRVEGSEIVLFLRQIEDNMSRVS